MRRIFIIISKAITQNEKSQKLVMIVKDIMHPNSGVELLKQLNFANIKLFLLLIKNNNSSILFIYACLEWMYIY